MNPDEYLKKAEGIKKRIDREKWKERKNFLIKKAKELKKEAAKKFYVLNQEPCDNCSKTEECPVCEPEFNKMRKTIEILGECQ